MSKLNPEIHIDKLYRQKNMRFSRFEDFVNKLMIEIEDEESRNIIRQYFSEELNRVIKRKNINN